MIRFTLTHRRLALFAALAAVAALAACSSSDGGTTTTGPGPGPGPNPPNGDYVTLGENGGLPTTHEEASGLPNIDCDPRVDWAFDQVLMWDNFTGGAGPSGYEMFLDILFPGADTVGTYTVQSDLLQVLYYNGENFMASPAIPTSSGTVVVTRSDTHIEGTFDVTVVDSTLSSIDISGEFAIEAGFNLSCP